MFSHDIISLGVGIYLLCGLAPGPPSMLQQQHDGSQHVQFDWTVAATVCRRHRCHWSATTASCAGFALMNNLYPLFVQFRYSVFIIMFIKCIIRKFVSTNRASHLWSTHRHTGTIQTASTAISEWHAVLCSMFDDTIIYGLIWIQCSYVSLLYLLLFLSWIFCISSASFTPHTHTHTQTKSILCLFSSRAV